MPRSRSAIPLNVFLNGRLVGKFSCLSSGAVEFQYDATWLDWEHAIPVSLSLPLREDVYRGDPVLAVFDNLLPDYEPIRRQLANRVHADGYDTHSLLAKIGRDCVGALQFLPEGASPEAVDEIKGRPVKLAEIAKKLAELETAPLGVAEDEEFRISLAGAQEKTALLYWKRKWHVPHGATPTTHILKPQIAVLPNGVDLTQSVENEFLCMKLTAAFGLPTANVDIAEFAGKMVLVIDVKDRQSTACRIGPSLPPSSVAAASRSVFPIQAKRKSIPRLHKESYVGTSGIEQNCQDNLPSAASREHSTHIGKTVRQTLRVTFRAHLCSESLPVPRPHRAAAFSATNMPLAR